MNTLESRVHNINRAINITSIDCRLYDLEAGIIYIITSQLSTHNLLDEILGRADTKCDAFKRLRMHRDWFHSGITRSTSYMLCICYIMDLDLWQQPGIIQLDANKINIWSKNILGYKIHIPEKYIKEINLGNHKIKFNSDIYKSYPATDIAKVYYKYKSSESCTYTTKAQQLQLSETYANFDGKCQGATRYWLQQRAITDQLNKPERRVQQLHWIKSLETKQKKLIDPYVNLQIDFYQKNITWNNKSLHHIQDIASNNQNLTELKNNIIKLLTTTQLNNLYVEIKTIEEIINYSNNAIGHAMGMSLKTVGNYFKLSFYDPNNKLLHWSKYIHKDAIFDYNFMHDIEQMPYFKHNVNNSLQIIASCYCTNKIYAQATILENSGYLKTLKDKKNSQQQLLLLSVITNNYNFTDYILNELKLDPNYLCNNATPLYAAVNNSNLDIVRLLLESNADPSMGGQEYSPLNLALDKKNRDIITLLTRT